MLSVGFEPTPREISVVATSWLRPVKMSARRNYSWVDVELCSNREKTSSSAGWTDFDSVVETIWL
jgi:hypothetical protein